MVRDLNEFDAPAIEGNKSMRRSEKVSTVRQLRLNVRDIGSGIHTLLNVIYFQKWSVCL